MACAAEHAAVNFIAVTAACAEVQRREDRPVDGTSLAVGAAAACLPSLPDFLEPAVHPSHRQFFHSVTFAVALSFGMRRVRYRR